MGKRRAYRKIAVAQLQSGADWRKNLALILKWTAQASRRGAEAILFPENALHMGGPAEKARVARELRNEKVLRKLARAARKNRIALLLGSYPETGAPGRKIWNTSYFFDERGKLRAKYRKIHLFDVRTPSGDRYSESATMAPGNRLISFTWRGVKIGLSICYDLRFPEQYRALSRRGAEWLFVPSAFTYETGKAHWHTLLRARAIENLATVFAPAQTGRHPMGRRTYGHSLVVGPWGDFRLQRKTAPGFQIARVSLAEGQVLRRSFTRSR